MSTANDTAGEPSPGSAAEAVLAALHAYGREVESPEQHDGRRQREGQVPASNARRRFGLYTAPGREVVVGGLPSTPDVRFSMRVGRGRRSHAEVVAQARTGELHRFLAALVPPTTEWRLLAVNALSSFADQPDLLRRACDPAETTLLAGEVYRAVLDILDAPYTVRLEVWRRYNAADQAAAAARGQRRVNTSSLVWVAGTATAQEVMIAPLRTIDTEASFIAHLRFLLSYSTLSTRTLLKAVAKLVQHSPSHSTLVGWLKGAKLPAQLSEPMLRAIVEALAEDILDDPVGTVRHVGDEHVKTFRMLLAQRQGDVLVSGPVHRALGVLAEQEKQLGDDGDDAIRRKVLRDVRAQILAALAADRAHAAPVSA